jgi:hypothetical protein
MQRTVSRDRKQSLLLQSKLSLKQTNSSNTEGMATSLPASKINETMGCNGLAKFRGRFERVILSNRQISKPIKFIILNKPIELACWCLLIELNFQTANHRP